MGRIGSSLTRWGAFAGPVVVPVEATEGGIPYLFQRRTPEYLLMGQEWGVRGRHGSQTPPVAVVTRGE